MVLGGRVDSRTQATVDAQTIADVRRMVVDLVILGADGVSPERGLTTVYRDQAELKAAMAAAANRVVAVADHAKVGHDQYLQFASPREVDTLITDDAVGDDDVAAFEALGTTVVRA